MAKNVAVVRHETALAAQRLGASTRRALTGNAMDRCRRGHRLPAAHDAELVIDRDQRTQLTF